MANEDKLLMMKRKITEAKSKVDQSKGALEQLENRLKSEFSVATIEEAEELVSKLETSIDQVEGDKNEIIAALEDDYDWD